VIPDHDGVHGCACGPLAFDDWRAKRAAAPSEAELAEAALLAQMRGIQVEFDDTYGELRMTPELGECGFEVDNNVWNV
jgi:hypothetical protein